MTEKPKKLLDQVRDKLRLKNYSYATEKTYIGWIRRYIFFHQERHPAEMGKAELGQDGLPEFLRIVINAAMAAEREKHLGAKSYERSGDRRGHANGYKPKTVATRIGKVAFDVPQVREGGFYPQALEKGLRSERALTLTLAEMYVQGVSTRMVAAIAYSPPTVITERLCGHEVSSMQVSRAAAQMDGVLETWPTRPLDQIVYLYLDARYEKVRQDARVTDAAVLVAAGVDKAGHRQLLGVSVALSEQEAH